MQNMQRNTPFVDDQLTLHGQPKFDRLPDVRSLQLRRAQYDRPVNTEESGHTHENISG